MFDAIQFTSVSASNDLDNNTVLNKNMLIKSISPNPFNGRASIVYQTLTREDITITIFNQLGQKIMQTKLPEHYKGNHTFVWDAKNSIGNEIPSGVYFFSIASSTERKTKKLAYIK